jgi:hypothetical protein
VFADYRKVRALNVPRRYRKRNIRKVRGSQTKGINTVAPKRRDIVHDSSSYPGIEKPRFWWRLGTTWADRLSELADYIKIHGAFMFLKCAAAANSSWLWVLEPEGAIQLAPEGIAVSHPTLKLDFEWRSRTAAWEDRLSELADSQDPRALQCSSNVAKTQAELRGS